MTFGADPGDLQRTQDRYELSLRADFAMDRLLERNNYKRALIALSQQQRAHLQLTDQVIAEVRKAWRDMEEAHDRSVLQVNAKKLAQQRLDTTLLLMQHGRANPRDVLRAQEDYYSAQEGYVTAMADFAVAKMNFLRDTEMLWIHPNGEYTVQTASAAK
jgi:outer membrane protein TolC